MAQRMLDEKTRVTEEPPPPSEETDAPFHTDGLYAAREAIESDGETLGSQDTEEDLSTISEEEEEETYEEAEKENIAPSRGASRKRRSASSLEKTLPRPPLRKKSRNNADEGNAQGLRKRRPRGNYRSWVRHRVAICQALRDAVFDRKMAAEILKRAHGLFVPPTVLGYYARKLLDLTDEDL
ncbi:protein 22K [Fowl aviadenovirus 2]|uniref:Protein 22K n=1 Tax=Fowl aviadenovirus 2 TaxID=172859 RepID=A0A191ULJ3_9ADEN|nr:protein 22K [Fowl aviadenovirus 2]